LAYPFFLKMIPKGSSVLSVLALAGLARFVVAAPASIATSTASTSSTTLLAFESSTPSVTPAPKAKSTLQTSVKSAPTAKLVSSSSVSSSATHSASATPSTLELEPYPASSITGEPSGSVNLNLQTEQTWYWGSSKYLLPLLLAPTDFILAGIPHGAITKFADPDERIFSTESFEAAIQDSQCNASSVSITYTNEQYYGQAKSALSWVSSENSGSRSIFLVNDEPSCSTAQRVPYNVTGVEFDDSTLTATLQAMVVTWEAGVSNGTALYDTVGIPTANSTVNKRLSDSGSLSANLAQTFNQQIFSKTTDGIDTTLTCANCSTTGTLDFKASITIALPPTFSFSVSTNDVGVTIGLDLSLSGELTTPISDTFAIASIPLPGSVKFGPVSIGPQLDVDFVTSLTQLSAAADIQFGVEANLADGTIGFPSNGDQFPTPSFTALGPTISGAVSVTGDITPEIILSIGASIPGASVSAGIAVQAPDFTLNLDAQTGGACGNPSAEAGIEFDVDVGFGVILFGGEGKATALANSVNIFTTSAEIFSTCVTVAGSTTAAAATTTSTSAPAQTLSATTFSDDCCGEGCTAVGINSESKLTFIADGTTCNQANEGGAGGINSLYINNMDNCNIQFFTDSACSTPPPSGLTSTSNPLANGSQCFPSKLFGGDGNTVNFLKMSCQ
jgi:hypothetical protein